MPNNILLKRSKTPSIAPASLLDGELAINQADLNLFASNGTGAVQLIASGSLFATYTANLVYASPATGLGTPDFRALTPADIPNLDGNKITSGFVNTARLGSGAANNTTFLRGDQTWATVTGGGGPTSLSSGFYIQSFTSTDLAAGILSVAHQLSQQFVDVTVYDNNDIEVLADNITAVSDATLTVDLSDFVVTGTWHIVIIGAATLPSSAGYYLQGFTAADLISGILTVSHQLGQRYVDIRVYDNNEEEILPDIVMAVSATVATVNLSSYTVTGTWYVVVMCGPIGYYAGSFTNASLVTNRLTVDHVLGQRYVGVQIYDNNNIQILPDEVTAVSTDTTVVDLTSYPVFGTWTVVVIGFGTGTGGCCTRTVRTINSSYAVTILDWLVRINVGNGPLTVTLPNAAGILGQQFVLKRIANSGSIVTVNTLNSQTIDGNLTMGLAPQYAHVTVVSNDVGWDII